MHSKFIIAAMLLFYSAAGFPQSSAPKYSNEFLSLGAGARALGMANVQTAIAHDATASYWNPSSLANLGEKHHIGLMHAAYFAGIANYDYAGYSFKIDSLNALGFSMIRFAIDDIPDTRFLYDANGSINYDNVRFFSAADYAFIASYGRKLPNSGMTIGLNAKVIHRKAGQFAAAWGFGLDAAAQMNIHGWQLGMMFRDITGTFNVWSHNVDELKEAFTVTGNEIPAGSMEITLPKAILGIGKRFGIVKDFGLLAAADFEFAFDGQRNVPINAQIFSLDPRLSFELDYSQIAFIRFGGRNFQQYKNQKQKKNWDWEPDFGVGIKIRKATIDYAFTAIGGESESLYSHVFSVSAAIEGKP